MATLARRSINGAPQESYGNLEMERSLEVVEDAWSELIRKHNQVEKDLKVWRDKWHNEIREFQDVSFEVPTLAPSSPGSVKTGGAHGLKYSENADMSPEPPISHEKTPSDS